MYLYIYIYIYICICFHIYIYIYVYIELGKIVVAVLIWVPWRIPCMGETLGGPWGFFASWEIMKKLNLNYPLAETQIYLWQRDQCYFQITDLQNKYRAAS